MARRERRNGVGKAHHAKIMKQAHTCGLTIRHIKAWNWKVM
jgi:hypothetical protein